MTHPEIAAEQAYLDRAHARLDAMREAARALSAEVVGEGAGGTFANRVERDIRVELSGRRLAQLNVGDGSVCFGRLDFSDGLTIYVGRIGVSDENGDQLVVDWRAPIAEAFYRATPAEPLGVARRRHFLFRGRTITSIDDELFDLDAPEDLVLMGEGALLAGLRRARTGRMHEIVSTIQAEQDRIIRSELAGPLVVQGGPGTGKTAVALHRAAYLLFAHRVRLERDGVLLVGPNSVFLRYIEQVLPSLGESSVALATPGELYAGSARPRSTEAAAVAALKGDSRMAGLLARAVETRERPLRDRLVVSYGRWRLAVEPSETRRIVQAARERSGTHNARRVVVERLLTRALHRAWREEEERAERSGRRLPISKEESARVAEELATLVRRDEQVRAALQRMWPLLTPEELLHDLFGAPALLKAAGRGLVSDDELALLVRARSSSLGEIGWTEADLALLDEAAALLGPATRRRQRREAGLDESDSWMLDRSSDELLPDCPACGAQLSAAGGDRPWRCDSCGRRFRDDQVLEAGEAALLGQVRAHLQSWTTGTPRPIGTKGARVYGHVVVDEAQQLSPMQWRALGRRCPSGSFTIVGDLGQASHLRPPRSWAEALSELRTRRPVRVEELTVNYRTPAEVMAIAARVLAAAAPELTPPSSVRSAETEPRFVQVGTAGLLAAAAALAVEERAAIGDGRVAVIAPLEIASELSALLEAPLSTEQEGLSTAEARALLDAPVAVLSLESARGLEFDSVVLVEPALLVAEHDHGLRALYVALTRTTTRLVVAHAEPLPECIEPAMADR